MMDDRRLDDLLQTWRVEPATPELRDAILAAATGRGAIRLMIGWRPRLWFAGAGLAAAFAGVSCGALLSQVALREQRDEALVAQIVSDPPVATAVVEPSRTL